MKVLHVASDLSERRNSMSALSPSKVDSVGLMVEVASGMPEVDCLLSFRPTSDDWHSNYPVLLKGGHTDVRYAGLGLVSVKVLDLTFNDPPTWRVFVEGTDDFAMAKDFAEKQQAVDAYMSICGLHRVSKAELLRIGFAYY